MKADPVERNLHDLVVARTIAHRVIGDLADKRLRITPVHGGLKKVEIVHGVVARGGGAVRFAIGLGIGRGHTVGAAHGCFETRPP